MKKNVFSLMLIVFFGGSTLIAQPRPWIPPGAKIVAKAKGRTHGHIADFSISNTTGRTINMEIPSAVIPSDGTYQGYAVPEPTQISVPRRSTVTVPLTGYCTDPDLPVPTAGTFLPDASTWDTGSPLMPMLQNVITTMNTMQDQGHIFTPLSDNPQLELEVITQQIVWIYSMPPGAYDPCQRISNIITDHFRDTDWYALLTLESGQLPQPVVQDYFAMPASNPWFAVLTSISHGIAQITDAIIRAGRLAGLDDFATPVLSPEITQPSPAMPSSHPDITNTAKAKGTGRTTGHIADLMISNPTKEPISVVIGDPGSSFLIPSDGRHQSYIVPSIPEIPIGPGQTVTVPIEGYCVDVRRPPVGDKKPMPGISEWIQASEPAPPDPLGPFGGPQMPPRRKSVTIPTKTAPPLSMIAEVLSNTPAAPVLSNWDCPDLAVPTTPLIPGTESPIRIPINTDEATGVAASILAEALKNITQAYDLLQKQEVIKTPFSKNRDKEREAVIQQTFWMYSSVLQGEPYAKEDFHHTTVKQFESNTNQKYDELPDAQKEKVDVGIDDFWDSFSAVGVEAKILPSIPLPPADMPAIQDVFSSYTGKPAFMAESPSPFSLPEDVLLQDKGGRKQRPNPKHCVCSELYFELLVYDTEAQPGGGWRGLINDNLYKETIRYSDTPTEESREVNADKRNIRVGEKQMIILKNIQGLCDCIEITPDISGSLRELARNRSLDRDIRRLLGGSMADVLKGLQALKDALEEKREAKREIEERIEREQRPSRRRSLERDLTRLNGEIETLESAVNDANDISALIEESRSEGGCPLLAEPSVTHRVVSGQQEGVNNGHFTDANGGFPGNNYRLTISKRAGQAMIAEFTITFECEAPDCIRVNCRRTLRVQID